MYLRLLTYGLRKSTSYCSEIIYKATVNAFTKMNLATSMVLWRLPLN